MTTRSGPPPLKLNDLDGITLRASGAFLALGQFLLEFSERVKPELMCVEDVLKRG
jgi:hypothetical protein